MPGVFGLFRQNLGNEKRKPILDYISIFLKWKMVNWTAENLRRYGGLTARNVNDSYIISINQNYLSFLFSIDKVLIIQRECDR